MRLNVPKDSRTKRRIKQAPIEESLLIRLTEDVGKLPAGFTYELPRFEAERLIMRRKATAVGTLGTMADLTLTQDECEDAGINEAIA